MRARGRRGDDEGFSESPVEEAERPALAVTGGAPGYTSTRLNVPLSPTEPRKGTPFLNLASFYF